MKVLADYEGAIEPAQVDVTTSFEAGHIACRLVLRSEEGKFRLFATLTMDGQPAGELAFEVDRNLVPFRGDHLGVMCWRLVSFFAPHLGRMLSQPADPFERPPPGAFITAGATVAAAGG